MAGPTYYYAEMDGMVYLVDRDGTLGFPTKDELPWGVHAEVDMAFDDVDVIYCAPDLDVWPRDWVFKDTIPGRDDVDPVVRRAVNMTLVREVTGAVVVGPDDRVLMVKAARGFTKGMWNVPGGFIVYGETPEEGVAREIKEETGIDVTVERLLGVYTARFSSPYFMRGFMYVCRASSLEFKVAPDEIAEAAWMDWEDARAATINPFAQQAFDAARAQSSHSTTS